MTRKQLENTNVESFHLLASPQEIHREFPAGPKSIETVLTGREVIQNILDGKDKRLFVVIGPCSIHDLRAAHEYAEKLKALADKVKDKLYLVMRVYFEKPRTTVGWKGLINDP